jgi:peptide/nickel transport system substrate-binding protein
MERARMRAHRFACIASVAIAVLFASSAVSHAQGNPHVLRAVIPGELRSIDPVWTTAEQTRYHGFMVYDTLFGLDAKLAVQPQMVDHWTVSDDKLTYTFTLRDGLAFTDGTPVTAADVVASWKRWAVTDASGQMINRSLATLEPIDAKTFRVVLKQPFGQLLFALAKPMAMPLFIMPARIANATSPHDQIKDPIGAGPFQMVQDEWVPGSRVVYVRNPGYVPRSEPASGTAGGKVARVDRVEWLSIPDAATQTAALQQGEVDFLGTVTPDLMPVLKRAPGITVRSAWQSGTQGILRLNHLNPPFDNPIARRAMQNFVNQRDMILAVSGDLSQGQVCGALLVCGSPNGSEFGSEMMTSNEPSAVKLKRGAEMLAEGGYKGQKIIVLDAQDQPQHQATLVLVDAMRRAGVNVDLQTMDWASVVTRRASKEKGDRGWHIFMTFGGVMGPSNPAFHIPMSAACDSAWYGWPCDEKLEALRTAWVHETDPIKARALAEDIQRRGMEITVYLPFGQFAQPTAFRNDLDGLLQVPETFVFWNVSKH